MNPFTLKSCRRCGDNTGDPLRHLFPTKQRRQISARKNLLQQMYAVVVVLMWGFLLSIAHGWANDAIASEVGVDKTGKIDASNEPLSADGAATADAAADWRRWLSQWPTDWLESPEHVEVFLRDHGFTGIEGFPSSPTMAALFLAQQKHCLEIGDVVCGVRWLELAKIAAPSDPEVMWGIVKQKWAERAPIDAVLGHLLDTSIRLWQEPTSFAILKSYGIGIFIIAVVVALGVFALYTFLFYSRYVVYDLSRKIKNIYRWQVFLIWALLAIVPFYYLGSYTGFLLAFFWLTTLIAPYTTSIERKILIFSGLIAAVLPLLLAMLPPLLVFNSGRSPVAKSYIMYHDVLHTQYYMQGQEIIEVNQQDKKEAQNDLQNDLQNGAQNSVKKGNDFADSLGSMREYKDTKKQFLSLPYAYAFSLINPQSAYLLWRDLVDAHSDQRLEGIIAQNYAVSALQAGINDRMMIAKEMLNRAVIYYVDTKKQDSLDNAYVHYNLLMLYKQQNNTLLQRQEEKILRDLQSHLSSWSGAKQTVEQLLVRAEKDEIQYLLAPIPRDLWLSYIQKNDGETELILQQVRSFLVGRVSFGEYYTIVVLWYSFLLFVSFYERHRHEKKLLGVSQPCVRCGTPSHTTPGAVYMPAGICTGCFYAFSARRARVDPLTRRKKSQEIEQLWRRRILYIFLSSGIPGIGHLLCQQTLHGMVWLFTTAVWYSAFTATFYVNHFMVDPSLSASAAGILSLLQNILIIGFLLYCIWLNTDMIRYATKMLKANRMAG